MALPTQMMPIPLSQGLLTKGDKRAKDQALDLCVDVEFDNVGGLRMRKPFTILTDATVTGGSTSDTGVNRGLAVVGDELVLMTQTGLYSWSASVGKWVFRDTHAAVTVTEDDVFPTNSDQSWCDRAELGNVIVTVWAVTTATGGAGNSVMVAARDKLTGAVLLTPTTTAAVSGPLTGIQIVALQTKILLLQASNTSSLKAIAIDPANLATSVAAAWTTIIAGIGDVGFDAIRIPNTDTALVALNQSPISSGSYVIAKVTAALAVTSATHTPTNMRSSDTLAVAIDPTVTTVVLAYSAGSASPPHINADVITLSTLAITHANVDLGAVAGNNAIGGGGPNPAYYPIRVAAAFRTDGSGKCFVFWASGETNSQITFGHPIYFTSEVNWIQATGTTGTKAGFIGDMSIASRAFDHGGNVYVWGVFAGQTPGTAVAGGWTSLQNTNFLYRDDGTLIAKCLSDRSAGFSPTSVGEPSVLPGVVSADGVTYTWCGTSRRIVPIGFGNTYSGRAPTDVSFTFDDDRARRSVQVGKTMYLPGGQVLQYDGISLTELGFHVFPWMFTSVFNATGSIAAGAYAVKVTTKSTNATGEIDRSTTATDTLPSISASQSIDTTVTPLYITRKIANPPTIEVWRTIVAPVAASPFYLVTSQDPTVLTNPNRYLPNDPTAITLPVFNDNLPDATILQHQPNPENGSVLAAIAPPPATIIASTDTRIFLGGIAGDDHTIWYSKQRNDGEVVNFDDSLTFSVPAVGGAITAVAFLNGQPVVFRETAIYVYAGSGDDNTGNGSNYELSRVVSTDLGAINQEGIANVDDGLMFKSDKGWFHLDLGLTLSYIGFGVATFDGETVVSSVSVTAQHQVRFLTANRLMLYDTLVSQWSTWSIVGAVDGVIWNGVYVYADANNVYVQNADYTGINYGFSIETNWIKINDQQGRGIARAVNLLGEMKGAFALRVRLARDYLSDGAGGWLYHTDRTVVPAPSTVGGPVRVRTAPTQKRCGAIKVRLDSYAVDGVSPPTAQSCDLTSLALAFAVEADLFDNIAATQKQ